MIDAALQAADLIDRGEVLIAGMAAMLLCIFLGPRYWFEAAPFLLLLTARGASRER